METMGLGERGVTKWLKAMTAKGKLERVELKIPASDGKNRPHAYYRMVK